VTLAIGFIPLFVAACVPAYMRVYIYICMITRQDIEQVLDSGYFLRTFCFCSRCVSYMQIVVCVREKEREKECVCAGVCVCVCVYIYMYYSIYAHTHTKTHEYVH